jgi:CBS domain-containing protein
MGEHDVHELDSEELRSFEQALLDDVDALEQMLAASPGPWDRGPRRIGAEQEVFLIDAQARPVPLAQELLAALDDPRFTTEMARFNLEANLTPRVLGGRCFDELEDELIEVLDKVHQKARPLGAEAVLAGILPTLRQTDLGIDNLSPGPRYQALNQGITKLRGGEFHVRIEGLDELDTRHDSVMLESCNTSFQVHLQVVPEEFARLYNRALLATGPVLAAAVNSPLLFGKRLWQETRIALFERSVDERSESQLLRGHAPRVAFGQKWLDASVLEIFREDIARFRIVLSRELDRPSTETWRQGSTPKLSALTLHNGTVYRWNRACYGTADGVAHLRIEQRALPAGPTLVDEVANGAFFVGLTLALADEPVEERLGFDDVRASFLAAAREGLAAPIAWIDGHTRPAHELILDELLPRARAGLHDAGVDPESVARYLGLIEERVRRGRTGSEWLLQSAARLGHLPIDARDALLTRAILRNQRRGAPVHVWPLARRDQASPQPDRFDTVGQLMSTDLYTVRGDDAVELAASILRWQNIEHLPVEDDAGELIGLVTPDQLEGAAGHAVGEVMAPPPPAVPADTPADEARALMTEGGLGCLAVVEGKKLVGLVTGGDFTKVEATSRPAAPA